MEGSTACKVSKYRVFSCPFLDTFHAVQIIYFPIGILVQSVLFRQSLKCLRNFEGIFLHNKVN